MSMAGLDTTDGSISDPRRIRGENSGGGDDMTIDDMQVKNFLAQLYKMTSDEIGAEVSMYDIGDALGLDKSESGSMAEDLIIDGYAELKTLAGGISITAQGLQALDIAPADNVQAAGSVTLGDKTIVEADVVQAVETLLLEIKSAVSSTDMAYEALEEIVIDIKTLETQLLSPRPKTRIVREILSSLSALLADQQGSEKLVESVQRMTGA